MSEIQTNTTELEISQSAQTGADAAAINPATGLTPSEEAEYAAADTTDRDMEARAEADAEADARASQPQTATANKEGLINLMAPDGISMRVFSENLIGDYALKDLTGDKDLLMSELPEIKAKAQKEPKLQHAVKGAYNFEMLQNAFKSLKALGQSYITIEVEPEGPICISAKKTDRMNGEWRFYLAPYMEG